MTTSEGSHSGGCLCGAVRYTVSGAPIRVGLCHCETCQKNTGAPYFAFAVFPSGQVTIDGTLEDVFAPKIARQFCPDCGSLIALQDEPGEIDLALGGFDVPPDFSVEYELWVGRRHPWIAPVAGATQHEGHRFG